MVRHTKQRAAIERVLRSGTHPLTAAELAARAARYHPGLGIATVYRMLQRLQEEGWVKRVEVADHAPSYECGGKTHHHHFFCRKCGTVRDVPGCVGRALERLVPEGCLVEDHEITLRGLCAKCRPGKPARAGKFRH